MTLDSYVVNSQPATAEQFAEAAALALADIYPKHERLRQTLREQVEWLREHAEQDLQRAEWIVGARALHSPVYSWNADCDMCATCSRGGEIVDGGTIYPCPTARALGILPA